MFECIKEFSVDGCTIEKGSVWNEIEAEESEEMTLQMYKSFEIIKIKKSTLEENFNTIF